MKATDVVAAAILSLTIVPIAIGQDVGDVVTLSPPEYDAERASVRIVVSNNARQAITAWEVGIRVIYADGVERGHSRAREGYAVTAGLSDSKNRVIYPAGSIDVLFYLPRSRTTPLMSVTPMVKWVVFEDKTALGDPAGVELAFAERERDRKAWSAVSEAMALATVEATSIEGLRRALDFLNAPAQDDFNHPIKRVMRRNVERALEQGPQFHGYFITHWSTVSHKYALEAARHGHPVLRPKQ